MSDVCWRCFFLAAFDAPFALVLAKVISRIRDWVILMKWTVTVVILKIFYIITAII